MDIFETAKKMELDGVEMYEQEFSKTKDESLKTILNMLISQEKKHYDLFDSMQKKSSVEFAKDEFKNIKNVFQQMKENKESLPKEQIEFYKKALEIENKSEQMYKEIAEDYDDSEVVEVINNIADEEHKHAVLIQNIIDMLKNADSWVENAEFNHLVEY
jgi:rubrerythrin